ncbi:MULTISPECIES: keywimysin-related RiPP [unclassified Nocardia]|nr:MULTISPECIES: keywimysin-related RiPP [unclassified Nocardia]
MTVKKQKYDKPVVIDRGNFRKDTGNLRRGIPEPIIVVPLGK